MRPLSPGRAPAPSTTARRTALAVIATAVAAAVAACSGAAPATPAPATAAPVPVQEGASGADDPAAQQAESTFLGDLRSAGVPITGQTTIQGYSICVLLAADSDQDAAAQQLEQLGSLTAAQATTVVTAARTTLCQVHH